MKEFICSSCGLKLETREISPLPHEFTWKCEQRDCFGTEIAIQPETEKITYYRLFETIDNQTYKIISSNRSKNYIMIDRVSAVRLGSSLYQNFYRGLIWVAYEDRISFIERMIKMKAFL
jgi:hypothetical protein